MKARYYLLLAVLGFGISFSVARMQSFPGYLDSDYYFGGGLQLVTGHGFTEPYIWNYLDDPPGLPHPSHTYWLPLSSVLAALGMSLTGQWTYAAGRLAFLVLAGLTPVATASLAYSFSHRTELAMVSGMLAVFSGYYAPFLPVTDNYAPYLVLGALFFLVLKSRRTLASLALGGLAGLMALARSDGLLWLGLAVAATLARHLSLAWPSSEAGGASQIFERPRQRRCDAALQSVIVLAAFLLVTGAWFYRTYVLYGTLLAPGGSKLLWLRNYDETFLYPANQLTFGRWIAQGWQAILGARLSALRWNLMNALAAQGELFLVPFILAGAWTHRRDLRVLVGVVAWAALLFVMTLLFPFAGARGGFFHAGAALQSLWWALAPLGLETSVAAARRRNWFTPRAFTVFRGALVGMAILITAAIIWLRVLPGWGEGEQTYPELERYLERNGIQAGEPVMVRNPPGYFVMTGRPAVVVPYGDADAMLAVAARYRVHYLIIESAGAAGPIRSVYEDLHNPDLQFLGQIDGTRLFRIPP